MKKLFPHLCILALLFCAEGITQAQTYQIISTVNSNIENNVIKTVTTVQVGSNPLNRFLMTRVRKNIPNGDLKGTILLLPPLGSGFQNYEVGDDGDYDNSFAGFFAKRDYDVWGYSQRVQGLTAGSCESNAIDCSVMADWGMQTIVEDVAFVRQQMEVVHPGEKPFVGGLSLGSIAGIATINAHPSDYAGAILIEGTLYDENPQVRNINSSFCAAFDDLLAHGVVYDAQGIQGFKLISQLAAIDPAGPTPLPGFPPGFTNHRAFVAAMSAPPLAPTTPRPGYQFLAGSVAEDRFFFVNEPLIHASISVFVDYVANRTIRDVSCGLAGERTFSNNLQSFNGSVIVFAGGTGFGTSMIDTANLMTSAKVTVNFRPEYGHVDYVFSNNHLKEVEHAVLKWLEQQ